MESNSMLRTLKVVGAGAIVVAAAFILMPGLLGYLMGLGRISIIVGTTLILATIAGNIIFRIAKRSRSSGSANRPADADAHADAHAEAHAEAGGEARERLQ